MTELKKQAQLPAPDETDINARQAQHNTQVLCQASLDFQQFMQEILRDAQTTLSQPPISFPASFWQTLKITLSFSSLRTSSRGGCWKTGPFINIAGRHHSYLVGSADDALYRFFEYARLAEDPVIGSFKGQAPWVFKALCVHEISHAVQYFIRVNPSRCRDIKAHLDIQHDDLKAPHGRGFRVIYRHLRQALINPHI